MSVIPDLGAIDARLKSLPPSIDRARVADNLVIFTLPRDARPADALSLALAANDAYALLAYARECRAELAKREWSGGYSTTGAAGSAAPCCPSCGAAKGEQHDDCELARLIGAPRAE